MRHETNEVTGAGQHIIKKSFVWMKEHVAVEDHGEPNRILPPMQRATTGPLDPGAHMSIILADHAYANFQRTEKPAQLVEKYFTMSCDRCDESLVDLKDAQQHYRRQHSLRGHLTCCCGHRFGIPADIVRHCAFHANESPHKCIDCCKVFGGAEEHALHQANEHADEYRPNAGAPSAVMKAEYGDNDVLNSVVAVEAFSVLVAPAADMDAEFADDDVHHAVAVVEATPSEVASAVSVIAEYDNVPNVEAMATTTYPEMSKKTRQAAVKRYKTKLFRYNKMINSVPDDDDALIGRYIPMVCIECDIPFQTFDVYWSHLATDHPTTRSFVECCNRQIYSKRSALKHCHWHDQPHELE